MIPEEGRQYKRIVYVIVSVLSCLSIVFFVLLRSADKYTNTYFQQQFDEQKDLIISQENSNNDQSSEISGLKMDQSITDSKANQSQGEINDITSLLSSLPKSNLSESGSLSFKWKPTELANTVMVEGENISLLNNDTLYITGSTTDVLSNKTLSTALNTISGLSVINFSSADISQWNNNAGYLTNADTFAQGGNDFGALAVLGTTDNNALAFYANNSEAVRILTNGNVGIGDSSPTSKLVVNDSTNSNGTVASFTRDSQTLNLYSNTDAFSIGTGTNHGLGFFTNSADIQMVLDTSGQLGIGTVSPGARLEIDSGILGTAGLKFSQLDSSTSTIFSNGKLLTLDASGNIILAYDQVGTAVSLPSGTTGQTLYHNGTGWSATSNLYNTGGRIGIGSTDPKNMLHIYGTDNTVAGPYDIQENGITIDGVADGDKFLTWADAGVNKWNMGMYRDENGRFLYIENEESNEIPLTITAAGRVGINTPPNVMNYHSQFTGSGDFEMDVNGVYTGEFERFYQIQIDTNGVPDTYKWRTSWDNINWDDYITEVAITGTAQNLSDGVTIAFKNTTGHTIGDKWDFTSYSQTPRGSFTIGPGSFEEVLYYNGSSFTDNTYNANITGSPSMDLLVDTGDYQYFGRLIPFGSIFLNLPRVAVGAVLVVEYWNGEDWTPLTVATNELRDNTSSLTQTGSIDFNRSTLTDWEKNTVSDYVDLYYWIRISTSETPSTTPLFDVATPNTATRLGIYSSSLDTNTAFSVDAVGHTIVGDGLEVTGIANMASIINAASGVSIGVDKSYTGLGTVTVSSAVENPLNIISGTTGALTLDSGTTGAVNLGTGANAKTIIIGNTTDTTSLTLNSGSGDISINPTTNDTLISGGYGSTGVTVDASGNIQINGNLTVDGTSTLTGLTTGTAGFAVAADQSYTGLGAVTVSSADTKTLTLDSGTTGAINIGTGVNTKTITIGNTDSSTSLSLVAGTGVINIGTNSIDLRTSGASAFSLDTSGNGALTGDLTISGNHLYMGTNTIGAILVADGTKFNPVVLSGEASIASNGSLTINYSAAQSADTTNKGFLTAADWNTFYAKQNALGFTPEDVANKSTDVLADGASDTKYTSAKAVKSYVDNLTLGLNWINSAENITVIADLATPIGSPTNFDSYIIKTGGNTGAWSTFAAGDLVQFQSPSWKKIKSLIIGDHFGVAFKSSTTPSGGMADKKDYMAEVTGGTPGAYTYTFTAPENNYATFVQNPESYYHNITYVYSSSLIEWVQLSAAVDFTFTSGLNKAGTVISLGDLTTDWVQSGAFNISTAGNIAINGGGLTTTAEMASLFNTNTTTLNIGGAATVINIGASGAVIAGAGALTLNSAATSTLTLDSGTTGALNIGTSANAKTVTIGNTTSTTSVVIDSGSGNISLNPTANSTLISGGYSSSGVTISSTGDIQTNGGLTVDGTSTLTGLVSGTAGFSIADGQSYSGLGIVNLSSATASALNITSGTTGVLTIDSGTTGGINIGTSANAKTITIGSSSSTAVKIGKLTTQYGVLYTSAGDGALAQTAAGSTGQCLLGNTSGAPTWGSCTSTAPFTKTGTNISPTTAGDDLLLNSNETLTIGGGTAITRHLSATATLDFPSIANYSCSSLTITVTGAAVGDTVSASPSAVASGIETFTSTTWSAYVSSTNTVTVRACKIGTATVNPTGQTWRVDVWQH